MFKKSFVSIGLLGSIILAGGCRSTPTEQPVDTPDAAATEVVLAPVVWFGNIKTTPYTFQDAQAKALSEFIRDQLNGGEPKFPATLADDSEERIFTVAIERKPGRTATIVYADGKGWREATARLFARLGELKGCHSLRLDVIYNVKEKTDFALRTHINIMGEARKKVQASRLPDPTAHGVAFSARTPFIYSSPELVYRGFCDNKREINPLLVGNYYEQAFSGEKKKRFNIWWGNLRKRKTQWCAFYYTRAYYLDSEGELHRLFRNHFIYDEVDSRVVQKSISGAVKFAQLHKGTAEKMVKQYDPVYCQEVISSEAYLNTRLLNLQLASGTVSAAEASVSIDSILAANLKKNGKEMMLEEKATISLRSNLNMLQAMLKLKSLQGAKWKYGEQARGLAAYAREQIDEKGTLVSFRNWPSMREVKGLGDAPRAEFIQTMIMANKVLGDREAMNSARLLMAGLLDKYRKHLYMLVKDPELVTAMVEYYKVSPSPALFSYLSQLTSILVGRQMMSSEKLDLVGAFNNDISSEYAAKSLQVYCAMYDLTRKFPSGELSPAMIQDGIFFATRYLLHCQLQQPNAMYSAMPEKILGGFATTYMKPQVSMESHLTTIVSLRKAKELMREMKSDYLMPSPKGMRLQMDINEMLEGSQTGKR